MDVYMNSLNLILFSYFPPLNSLTAIILIVQMRKLDH